MLVQWEEFRRHMDDGESRVRLGDWKGARRLSRTPRLDPRRPSCHDAAGPVSAALDPVLPGFTIVGDDFDSKTGLPKEVKVLGLDIPMVLIPPGEFDLGTDRLAASQPVHTVVVEAFYLGKFELTRPSGP